MEKGGVHGNTREDYVENGTNGRTDGRTFTVGIGYRNVIKGGTGTEFKETEQAMGAFPLKPTWLGLVQVSTGGFPLQLGTSEG